MTADELVQVLEVERAQLRPGRHMTPPALDDRPETCAGRLAAVTNGAYGVDFPRARKMRRRAYDRAREAAGS